MNSSAHLNARIAAITHQGAVRGQNEDAIAIGDWLRTHPLEEPQQTLWRLARPLSLLVCDGMGGHEAGEVASDLAARQIQIELTGAPSVEAAKAALDKANQAIFAAARADPRRHRMGTTAAGLWCDEVRAVWYNVGDSPIFRLANGMLMKLSIDDTSSFGGGAITQALGGTSELEPIEPHAEEAPLFPGTSYLLCSDGLTDMVPFDVIEELMSRPPAAAVRGLFEHAMAAGATDNVSIIVAAIEEEVADASPAAAAEAQPVEADYERGSDEQSNSA